MYFYCFCIFSCHNCVVYGYLTLYKFHIFVKVLYSYYIFIRLKSIKKLMWSVPIILNEIESTS